MGELQKQDLKTDKRPYNFKKRSCPLSIDGAPKVDYKNIKLLKRFISEKGKILPSRITNVSTKNNENYLEQLKERDF